MDRGKKLLSDERRDAILSGVEKIKQEKPFDTGADAIAALDWLAGAIDDVRRELARPSDNVRVIAALDSLLDTLQRLHSSVIAAMNRADENVPRRHQKETGVERVTE